MDRRRSCHWMSGPRENSEIKISAARWWIAISRDVLGRAYRQQADETRSPVLCQRTPTFVSPLGSRRL